MHSMHHLFGINESGYTNDFQTVSKEHINGRHYHQPQLKENYPSKNHYKLIKRLTETIQTSPVATDAP